MWKPFKCRLFREHDYQLCREPGALYLECVRCGRRSPGWELSELRVKRYEDPLQLILSDSGNGSRANGGSNGNGSNGNGAGSEVWAALMETRGLRLTLGEDD